MGILDNVKNSINGVIAGLGGETVCPVCKQKIPEKCEHCPECGAAIVAAGQNNEEPGMDKPEVSFLHDADRKALTALKAIPGFPALLKGFMKIWSERQFRIQNMSSNIRLGPGQMPEIYRMLDPICEKLNIETPELYVTMNVVPNAWTYGDTKPFITLTSGLLNTMPRELIPTVLAHECGHIACRHVLYSTMASVILGGATIFTGNSILGQLVTTPLQVAFYYWNRCSELSADRAAALCDGTADRVTEMCMRFAGYDRMNTAFANKQLFMEQALEYREMIKSSAWDKTLEFLMLRNMDHPFNAVRALECDEWMRSRKLLTE